MSNVSLTTPSTALMRQITLMSSEGGSCRETGTGFNGEEKQSLKRLWVSKVVYKVSCPVFPRTDVFKFSCTTEDRLVGGVRVGAMEHCVINGFGGRVSGYNSTFFLLLTSPSLNSIHPLPLCPLATFSFVFSPLNAKLISSSCVLLCTLLSFLLSSLHPSF